MGQTVTDMGSDKKSKKELKKHAATIHCSNTLSLLQRKISNALLYHAYNELMLKDEHEITVKQLCRLIGYQGNNHAAIKEALRELISTVIEWNLIDAETGNENWTASSIIASVSLEGPLCYYAYSPRMKQLLHMPSMFGKIDLVIQSHFRSSYGLALYENCIRYRGLPYTKWFEMALFKKLMGVPSGKYDVFRDFKRRVLDKAVDEVNTYSDLTIAAEYVREGRKVTKIRFTLKERAKKLRLGSRQPARPVTLDVEQDTLKTMLSQDFGLSALQIEQVLTDYDEAFIREKMVLIKASKAYQDDKIENIAGYLLSALKHNYQPKKVKSSATVSPKAADRAQDRSLLKRQIEAIQARYHAYRDKAIQEAIGGLSSREQHAFMEAFRQFAAPVIQTILKLQRKKYTHENVLDSPHVKALLRQYAVRELDTLSLMTLEEFVAQQEAPDVLAWGTLRMDDPDHPLLRFSE